MRARTALNAKMMALRAAALAYLRAEGVAVAHGVRAQSNNPLILDVENDPKELLLSPMAGWERRLDGSFSTTGSALPRFRI